MPRHTRIPSLDGLRAVSIVFVLSAHATGTLHYPFHYALDGGLGVRIFFVISGFIITHLMLDEEHQTGSVSLRQFYRRRALRILPPFWCYLATIAILGWIGVFHIQPLPDLIEPLTFTNGFWFWSWRTLWETVHSWSLAIEEHFYLLWPMAFVLLGSRRRRIVILALLLFFGPVMRGWLFDHPTKMTLMWTILGNFDMLGWGCLLALLIDRHPHLIQQIVKWRPWLGRLLAIVVIQYCPLYFWRAFNRVCPPMSSLALSMSAQAIAVAYLIASLTEIRRGILYRVLNNPIAVYIGLWSYSLYLWQQLFLHETSSPRWWEIWPTNIVLAFATAIASYYLIERPMRRFRGPRRSERLIAHENSATSEPMLVL